jgi:hypothetical protein
MNFDDITGNSSGILEGGTNWFSKFVDGALKLADKILFFWVGWDWFSKLLLVTFILMGIYIFINMPKKSEADGLNKRRLFTKRDKIGRS